MKVFTFQSKVWWLVKPDEIRPKKGFVVVDAVKLVAETFKFAGVPTSLPSPNDGYVFRAGGIVTDSGPVALHEFSIFNDGISVEVYSTTDDVFMALEQILNLMWSMGFSEPITSPKYMVQSMITFETDADLNKLATAFDPLTKAIAEITGAQAPHELRTIEYTVDPTSVPQLESRVFRLERRVNDPYSMHRWFSFANAKTRDHLRVLELIEQTAREFIK
jgi:hypothetical protein